MFSKLVFVLVSVAVVCSGQHAPAAAQFPAGVDPAACPNYPNCDNAALHNQQPQPHQEWSAPAQQWNAPAQQWNAPASHWQQPAPVQQQWNAPAPQWNAAPAPSAWNAPALQGPASNHLASAGGDKYPAGVNPQSCPNYPYCDTAATGYQSAPQVAPLPGWTERQYPAGVSAQECPNFPYCHS